MSKTKIVYLIRHAESEENRRVASLGRCFSNLGKFSLPSSADAKASTELLNIAAQVDSNVSEIGAKQIAEMGEKLKEADFLAKTGVKLVAHSPLTRARETCEGMLGCNAGSMKADSVDRVEVVDLLMEKTLQEWTPLYYSTFKQRIQDFEQWLADQPEEIVAIVGHSQYFKAMLGLNFKFRNCDVWKLTFDPSNTTCMNGDSNSDTPPIDGTLPPQWRDIERIHECSVKPSNDQD